MLIVLQDMRTLYMAKFYAITAILLNTVIVGKTVGTTSYVTYYRVSL